MDLGILDLAWFLGAVSAAGLLAILDAEGVEGPADHLVTHAGQVANAAGGVNVNELFAAQSIEDFKGFLRLRIDPDGSLTVYPIGIERRVRHWLPAGDGGGPRQIPAQGERLDPMLLEPPIHLR